MIFPFRMILPGIIWAVILLRPAITKGAEWSFTPVASEEVFYNDNYLLSSAPHQPEWGDIFLPEASFTMENEKLNLAGKGHFVLSRFFKNSALDTDEHDLTISASLNMTEKSLIRLSETNQVDSTLESELNQTGLFSVWTERYLNTLSLGYDQKINERINLKNNYNYTEVSYAGNNLELNDYYVHSFSTSLETEWNERMTLFADAHFSYTQIEGFVTLIRDKGITGGSKYRFSESSKGTFSAGSHWTDTSISYFNETLKSGATGWTLESRLDKEFESGHVGIELTRDIRVSGTGTIVQVDRFSAGYDRNLSERFSVSFNGAISSSQPFANSFFFPRSEYHRVEGKMTWQASDEISMTLEYSYARVATEGMSDAPVSNSAYLMVTWQPLKHAISR